MSLFSRFEGQKVTFGLLLGYFGRDPKSRFCFHFWVAFDSSGFRAFYGGSIFSNFRGFLATRPATLRGKWHSERVSERAFEKPLKTSKNLWKPLKTSQTLSKPLKTSENLWNPPSQRSSQRPSQRQIFLSEPLSPVAPNRVAPWNSWNSLPSESSCFPSKLSKKLTIATTECTAVAAIRLRMRMRILTRPENSLANFGHQVPKKKLRIKRCEGIR